MSTSVPVGLDVERIRRTDVDTSLIGATLTAEERRALSRLPPEERERAFLKHWTRKEAVLKATGHGLRAPLNTLGVAERDGALVVLNRPRWLAGMSLTLLDLAPAADHVAALAILGSACVVELDGAELLGSYRRDFVGASKYGEARPDRTR
jgi:4'-phosphopantetheinyl transferase